MLWLEMLNKYYIYQKGRYVDVSLHAVYDTF